MQSKVWDVTPKMPAKSISALVSKDAQELLQCMRSSLGSAQVRKASFRTRLPATYMPQIETQSPNPRYHNRITHFYRCIRIKY